DRGRARVPRPPRRPHAERVRLPDRRGPARARRGHRRGGTVPVRPRRLRHPRRIPARPAERGRLPDPGDRGQHERGDRAAGGRAREARERLRPAAREKQSRAGGLTMQRLRGGWRSTIWIWYLAVTGALTSTYFFVPGLKGSGPLINCLGLSGVAAIALGITIQRPTARFAWWLFVVGQSLFFSAVLCTYTYPNPSFPP